MLMIRLQRIGRKKDPHFRVVVTEKQNGPKSGKALEVIGSYNAKMGDFTIKADRAQHWMSQGAQLSDTIHNFFVTEGIVSGKKKNVLPKKSPLKKEGEEAQETPSAEAKPEEKPAEAPKEEEKKEEKPAEEDKKEESKEEPKEEAPQEKSAEEKKEEPKEEPKEETKEETEKTEA